MRPDDQPLRWLGPLSVLLAPILGVLVLRAPLVSAIELPDPWFYSGHAWTLSHHVDVLGWTYYGVRFPAILPLQVTSSLFGTVGGYVLVHYGVMVLAGAAVFAALRRCTTPVVAAAGVVLLAANPFFLRLVTWDYVSYVAVPCAIAGCALWLIGSSEPRRARRWDVAAGALVSAAVFANGLMLLVLPALMLSEIAGMLVERRVDLRRWAVRLACAGGGAIALFGLGYLGYALSLGLFDPLELVRASIDYVEQNREAIKRYRQPASVWLDGEPRVWAPLILLVAMAAAMGRDLLVSDLRARLACFALAFAAVTWGLRVLSPTVSNVETWWAYSTMAVSMAFAAPLLLDAVRRSTGAGWRALAAAASSSLAVALIVRSVGAPAVDAYTTLRESLPVLAGMLALGVVLGGTLAVIRRPAVAAAAAGGVLSLVMVLALTPAVYFGKGQIGEFSRDGDLELRTYRAAREMVREVARTDRVGARTLTWSSLRGPDSGAWASIPQAGGGLQVMEEISPVPELRDTQVVAVQRPDTARILVFGPDAAAVRGARAALAQRGVGTRVDGGGAWARGLLTFELLEVLRPDAAPPAAASR